MPNYVIVQCMSMLSSTELCYRPCYRQYIIVHRAMLSSMLSSICYRPQSYVIFHMLLSMLSSTELCYHPNVIFHVIIHRAMLSSMISSTELCYSMLLSTELCYRPHYCPFYRPQSYVIVHMLSSMLSSTGLWYRPYVIVHRAKEACEISLCPVCTC